MAHNRRSFLKGALLVCSALAVPGPLKFFAKALTPKPITSLLFVSIASKRSWWPAVTAVAKATAQRANLIRAAWLAAGTTASISLRNAFRLGSAARGFNPIFCPSLRSPLTGLPR